MHIIFLSLTSPYICAPFVLQRIKMNDTVLRKKKIKILSVGIILFLLLYVLAVFVYTCQYCTGVEFCPFSEEKESQVYEKEKDTVIIEEIEEKKVTKETILFRSNNHFLTKEAKGTLNQIVKEILSDTTEYTLTINGYTNTKGNQEKNFLLSTKRAERVKEYLAERGLSAAFLVVVGNGEEDPVLDERGRENLKRGRRAEIIVSKSYQYRKEKRVIKQP